MSEPFLHFRDVRFVRKSICGRRCPHGVNPNAYGFRRDAGLSGVLHDDVAIDGPRIEVPIERSSPIVCHRPEQGTVRAFMAHRPAVLPRFELLTDQPQCHRVNGNKPNLVALAFDAKVHDALAALQIAQA